MEVPNVQFDYNYLDLMQRIIKVEEALKHQGEYMKLGFEAMDKRFEDLQHYMDKRFEAMDKRFNTMLIFIGGSTGLLSLLITIFTLLR